MSIVIAGGGLSGATLAAHLAAEPRVTDEVTVVDDGRSPFSEAGWAYWSDRPGLLSGAVSRTFDCFRVHAGGRDRTLGLGRYRYHRVRGTDFAAEVERLIGAHGGVTFRRGRVERVGDGELVVDGERWEADWVFDSVAGPRTPPPADARLVFRGWHLRSEEPVFDPEVVTFADFRTAQDLAASFVYVLPRSPAEALVELTSFTAPEHHVAPEPRQQRAALAEYLEQIVGTDRYTVLREEGAALPLTAAPAKRRSGRTMAIGTKAGLAKASTGFAYQRIQRDSAAIVRSLRTRGHPFAVPAGAARYRWFDGALLDVVVREPARLEQTFAALFDRGSAEPVLRFLDEASTPWQDGILFAGLPTGLFAAAVARRAR
ncbi:lycopene cyclase family protein [Amycolatopsis sp. CA-230715]|uniref:lycopene cyclase family protein n=1 Tax=Amycolatopsis sp. CA-230715 TaxID=2745196 RepID=UPI001C01EDEF|nr:lycopene cyclase family protein [Amycolatopsis sp. CA-230715]QWF77953.1 hypothetical protein HUW46_01346 [Amycolatopsis sp. CA-230715]